MLCAATAGLLSAQGRPAHPEPPRFASWDEMNLLAHGLLQLGHGLREHVERTSGQLGALERRMAACGNACQGPKGKDAPFKDPEDRVPEGQTPETLQSLQTQLKAQNSKIQQLFQKVAQQQKYLSKQNLRIQNLQSQIDLLAPTHLDNGVDKASRGKRLPKMAQLIGLTPNATRLHSEYLWSLLSSGNLPTVAIPILTPPVRSTLIGKKETLALGSCGLTRL